MAAKQVTTSLQTLAAPRLGNLSHDRAAFRSRLLLEQGRAAAISLLVAPCTFGFSWVLVTLLLGPAYASTLTFLPILLLKHVFYSCYAILGVGVVALGRSQLNFYAGLIATPVTFILGYCLLRSHGLVGLAWAQVIGNLLILMLVIPLTRVAMQHSFPPGAESVCKELDTRDP
jgi:O-antigen/teichoic acid export membrane protein